MVIISQRNIKYTRFVHQWDDGKTPEGDECYCLIEVGVFTDNTEEPVNTVFCAHCELRQYADYMHGLSCGTSDHVAENTAHWRKEMYDNRDWEKEHKLNYQWPNVIHQGHRDDD